MKFKPTNYQLVNAGSGRIFQDAGWTLADPEASAPSLVRAVYENEKFTPRDDLKGLYRYAEWLPINRTLKNSHAPVTYRSKGLAELLGMENLYITLSGYVPKRGAKMETCSFKETEAFSVCARLPKNDKHILVVQSAGNTARAFARVCSDNDIPIVICIPNDNISDLWFLKRLKPCVKVIATPNGTDYYDAIALGEKLCKDSRYLAEGGAKNIARRDGMGTTLLSAVETIGRIPDAFSGSRQRNRRDRRLGKRMQACQGRSFRREQDEGLLRSERSFHPYVRFLESRIKRPCADHSGRVQKERRGDPREGSFQQKAAVQPCRRPV